MLILCEWRCFFGRYQGHGDRLEVWNEDEVLTCLLGQRMTCQVYLSENQANNDVEQILGRGQPAGLSFLILNVYVCLCMFMYVYVCLCFMLMPGKA